MAACGQVSWLPDPSRPRLPTPWAVAWSPPDSLCGVVPGHSGGPATVLHRLPFSSPAARAAATPTALNMAIPAPPRQPSLAGRTRRTRRAATITKEQWGGGTTSVDVKAVGRMDPARDIAATATALARRTDTKSTKYRDDHEGAMGWRHDKRGREGCGQDEGPGQGHRCHSDSPCSPDGHEGHEVPRRSRRSNGVEARQAWTRKMWAG